MRTSVSCYSAEAGSSCKVDRNWRLRGTVCALVKQIFTMHRTFLVCISTLLYAAWSAGLASAQDFDWGKRNSDFPPAFEGQFRAPIVTTDVELATRVLAEGLDVPWGVAVLPDGKGLLLTERSGKLRHLSLDGTLSAPLSGLPAVHARGQGGLLDVAVGPDFGSDLWVYMSYAKPLSRGRSVTAAARARINKDLTALSDLEEIFVQTPPSSTSKHYGSRLVFDGAGHLFITTGEHSSRSERRLAQDLSTSYGKVIRLTVDGKVPASNPHVGETGHRPEIWSSGHRNIQGAALDAEGRLWTIEHGPRGGDELNRPEAGKNYGWPIISYGINYIGTDVGDGIAVLPGLEQPEYFWDPVIAPSGMSFHSGDAFPEWNGDLLIGGLVARAIVRLDIDAEGRVRGEERLLRGIGRVRDVDVLPDGSIIALVEGRTGSVVHITPER